MPTLDEVCVKWNLWDRSAVHYWVRKYTAEGRHLAVPLLPSPPAQVSTPAAAPDSGNNYKNAYKKAGTLAAKKGYSLCNAANAVNKQFGTRLGKDAVAKSKKTGGMESPSKSGRPPNYPRDAEKEVVIWIKGLRAHKLPAFSWVAPPTYQPQNQP